MPLSRRTVVVSALVLLVAGGGLWMKRQRAADTPTPASPASAASAASAALALTPQDLWTATSQPLNRHVEVSGPLRAVNSAWVKAKVPGELKSLSVREGDTVRAGQVLGQIDTTELDWRLRQAQQQAEAAKAQADVADRTLANNRALVSQGFISPTALDTSQANANGARANLQAAQAAVALARKSLADASLVAPLGGLVAQRLVQAGERVSLDARVLEVVDLSRMELEAALPPQAVAQIRVGAQASLMVDGLSEPIAAQVVRINPSASAGTRTVAAYLSIAPHPGLRQGLFASGRITLPGAAALVVPSTAIRLDLPEPSLLVLEGQRVIQRKVTLGNSGEAQGVALTEVLSGLKAGEQVLTAQAGAVRSGTLVKPPSAMGVNASATSASAPR
ncbi:MAG: efflux transporter periplasmic adaptor subunit [Ideonella sp. MAG2]|nr:MAG: efflux transporter periplasmic adaptor subunit [Ideonella sp. MAG2]